jgi:hypothetical protein
MDPLAEKYANWSPYNYVGNNPIIRIDSDGRDWDVVINHNEQSITIKANFTTFSGNDATMQKAADTWNGNSGKFSYVIGQGDAAISYSVNFDITINDGSNEASAGNNVSVAPDKSKVFEDRVKKDSNGNTITAEGLSDGESIVIKESQKENTQYTAHEMGHNIGMTDTKGVMNGLGSGRNLKSVSIRQTLGRSGIGNPVKGSTNGATLKKITEIGNTPENFKNGVVKTDRKWNEGRF